MGDYTARFSELHYPLLFDYADSFTAAVNSSAWINMAVYHRGVLVLNVGEMQAGSVLSVRLQEATTIGGLGGVNIAGKNITDLVQADGDGDDLVCIELQTEELNVSGGFNFVRVVYHVQNAAVELSWIFYGIEPRYAATPVANWTEVVP